MTNAARTQRRIVKSRLHAGGATAQPFEGMVRVCMTLGCLEALLSPACEGSWGMLAGGGSTPIMTPKTRRLSCRASGKSVT